MELFNEFEDLCLSIKSIEIINGYRLKEPTMWKLNFHDNNSIDLRSDELDNPVVFRDRYLQLCNCPAPRFKTVEMWDKTLKIWSDRAQVVDITEYSGNIEIARKICFYLGLSFFPDSDPEDFKCIFDNKDGYYYVPVITIKAIIKDLHLKIKIKVLKKILENLKIKSEVETDEECLKICNQHVEVWKFYPAKLEYSEVVKW